MFAPRRNQRRQTIEQLYRCRHEADADTGAGLHALIDQVLGIDLTQPFQCKGQTGTVAQPALQTVALVGGDAHLGIDREAAVCPPLGHHLRIVRRQQAVERSSCRRTAV
jgi:hypothetical protein